MIFERQDIERLAPLFLDILREEIEKDKFLPYPRGIQEHLGVSYKRVNSMWNKPDFPRIEKEVKGVYLSELNKWMRK